MIKHPLDRAERLQLKRKHSFKHTRLKGLSDGTNDTRTTDETPNEAIVGIRDEEDQPRTP